ncbi:hypothetical protein Dtox_3246 [Desulfofarcimen acetoxidans DSM 771]|uniref:Prepilin-type N-terminal cleavage/methylation domain-containing protein n=1 Tax=Desulfofarcimen acetoxidans (strain ATCC 49208 / DSM 771 / KCTC 5769 / VKM B-1644 / 5575) TaxID=485916 RepID=C8W4U5_DESAS|nr:prepilin-type N-terminal cleavage/methylation domain-containing protein [Desulfofarcimen acetoxidans]ACV63981.1 hypothetical protein Dtox_3246 [Desulfofarcimen acetoxidans DSM 771]
MHEKLKKQFGFTLVEILVSMAIISIVSAAFIALFSSSFVNTFSTGNRNAAMSLASDKMEALLALGPTNIETIRAKLLDNDEMSVQEKSTEADLYAEANSNLMRFRIEPVNLLTAGTNNGYRVTIVVYYKGGERYVTLTSFIRGRS